MKILRRKWRALAALWLAVLVLLAACGSGDSRPVRTQGTGETVVSAQPGDTAGVGRSSGEETAQAEQAADGDRTEAESAQTQEAALDEAGDSDSAGGQDDDTDTTSAQNQGAQKTDEQETDTQKSHERKPDTQGSDAQKPDAQESDAQKPDTQKSDAQKPDAQGSDAQKPDAQESDAQKPDVQESDAQKSNTQESDAQKSDAQAPDAQETDASDHAGLSDETAQADTLDPDGEYTTKEDVALYLHLYGCLPSNYITKQEARDLGWDSSKGNLWNVAPGKSIGGDYFGNREELLPKKKGRSYYECDINYSGGYRGGERIVFSNDGLIYYSADHYENFELLYDAEGRAE